MNKIFFFPKYSSMGPSSRYRIYSYLPYYSDLKIEYEVFPLLGDWYLSSVWNHKSKLLIFPQVFAAYLYRVYKIISIPPDSIVYIGAELLPYFPSWLEKYMYYKGIKYLIEFDDAVFHNYDRHRLSIIRKLFGGKFKKIISNASAVICGCQYLADYSCQWNKNVYVIPTCIDGLKYNVTLDDEDKPVIGWIGSSTSSSNISLVVEPLKRLKKDIDYELHLIGFDRKYESFLGGLNYRIIKWTENTEIENMSKFTIGIMPLNDTPFSRGKCAFKLVQYMAIGIPTISTPLQSNKDIDKGCGNLFASSDEEWFWAFKKLLTDKAKRDSIGKKNKIVAMKYYTFQTTYMQKINILMGLNNKKPENAGFSLNRHFK